MQTPKVWFPAVRAHSGTDVFTERLCAALNAAGIRAEITWLPLRAEYAPWSVRVPLPPAWANIVHVNSWLHPRFFPRGLGVVSTLHSCVHDPSLAPFKRLPTRFYHALWIRYVEGANLHRAACVVAVSHYTARSAQLTFGLDDLEMIYNGVDTDFFQPVDRKGPNRPFRLLYVGNWNPLKGVDLFAPILSALGSGFELAYTADRAGAHESFSMIPNSRNLGRLSAETLVHAYQNADALLFPSRVEGFGLVAAEAMACGLPVIAANTSSLPEVVEDGKTGVLCAVDDVTAFVVAARALAENTERWQTMRRAARDVAVMRFSSSRQLTCWVNLYQRIMGL